MNICSKKFAGSIENQWAIGFCKKTIRCFTEWISYFGIFGHFFGVHFNSTFIFEILQYWCRRCEFIPKVNGNRIFCYAQRFVQLTCIKQQLPFSKIHGIQNMLWQNMKLPTNFWCHFGNVINVAYSFQRTRYGIGTIMTPQRWIEIITNISVWKRIKLMIRKYIEFDFRFL